MIARELMAILAADGGRIEIGHRVKLNANVHAALGANVTVLGGVTIGDGAVVGAGSVVMRAATPYAVVAGVPARPIGHRGAARPELNA